VLSNPALDYEQTHRIELSVEAYDCPNNPTKRQLGFATVSTTFYYCFMSIHRLVTLPYITLHYIIVINVFKEQTSITLQELNAIEKMSF